MFAFMLVSLIRHSVLSMTAAVLLVLLFTPGVRVLVDLFNLPAWSDNIWIVQLLGEAVLFIHGQPIKKLTGDNILDQFMDEIYKL